jgi:hypothetical protein
MKKVLFYTYGGNVFGGIESIGLGIIRHIRRDEYKLDFLFRYNNSMFAYSKEIASLGASSICARCQ